MNIAISLGLPKISCFSTFSHNTHAILNKCSLEPLPPSHQHQQNATNRHKNKIEQGIICVNRRLASYLLRRRFFSSIISS